MQYRIQCLPLLGLLCAAPGLTIAEVGTDDRYPDATVLAIGEAFAFGHGHSLIVEEVVPNEEGAIPGPGGEEAAEGTVARIEFCAGEKDLDIPAASVRRFRETRGTAQGNSWVDHVYSMSDRSGLREPLFQFVGLEAGKCRQGWIDFIEVSMGDGWGNAEYETISMAIAFSTGGDWEHDAESADAVWLVPGLE